MVSDTSFGLVTALYTLSFLLLAGLTLFIARRGGGHTKAQVRLRRTFFLLALSLLLWQATLFLEAQVTLTALQIWLGRINFTAVVFTTSLALQFVREVAGRHASGAERWFLWLWLETWGLAALTLFTSLVDAAEKVESSQAISTYGPLFPIYMAHVIGCLATALILALKQRRRASHPATRGQLAVIATGMLATGTISFVTNAILPFVFGEFRFCDVGTLSTVFFCLAIAYATFIHRLFSVRVLLQATLVYGILLAFALGTYSSTIFILTQYVTKHADQLTQFAVLFIAFSFDPLRRFLEKKVDRFLFHPKRKPNDNPKRSRSGQGFLLSLLFPWSRP